MDERQPPATGLPSAQSIADRRSEVEANAVSLSHRERQVLDAVARGSQDDEMAAALHLSAHTIRSHAKSALRKLGARTRAHAVAIAYSTGALELSTP
jgi:DNA-binding CsgD family transcriptional regulator